MKIMTWNINSVRIREPLISRFLRAHAPDVLCLQETKVDEGAMTALPRDPMAVFRFGVGLRYGER